MKKITLVIIILSAVAFQFCSTSKNASKHVMKMSYQKDIAPIVMAHCSPCHFPDSGKKLPLNTYEAMTTNLEKVLFRVQLPLTDEKFMPWKSKKQPLSDSLIQVIKLWRDQEMPI